MNIVLISTLHKRVNATNKTQARDFHKLGYNIVYLLKISYIDHRVFQVFIGDLMSNEVKLLETCTGETKFLKSEEYKANRNCEKSKIEVPRDVQNSKGP